MNRARRLKLILWTLLGLGASAAVLRLLFGMGATTNLSDAIPWGLWIGFDLSAVAMAAGGFVLAATVYIFRLERFHHVVRLSVLASFLTYAAFSTVLFFEIGLPWNIWHMIVYWNPHSPLFEVGWCVMVYSAVLALEFLPVPAEEYPLLRRIRTGLIKARLPLVIIGIALSTLHQSSLGSLFLIMPYRVHPLWYSPILPLLFLVSAIALGLSMVIVGSLLTCYLYRRQSDSPTLSSLGSASRWVLLIYAVLRLADILVRGQAAQIAAADWHSFLFLLELLLMAILPIVLFSIGSIRRNSAGQWLAAVSILLGTMLNRFNVGGIAHLRPDGYFYFPSWVEIAITLGVIAAATLAFLFMVERFKVWEERPADPDAEPLKLPEFDPVSSTWLGVPGVAARTVYSLGFVLAAALGFAFFHAEAAAVRGVDPTPVQQARGSREILFIDGNRDGFGVSFKHAEHEKREGDKQSCLKCHHMNIPRDQNSTCARCHSDQYLAVDAFRHDWHASSTGGRVGCYQCHAPGQVRSAATAARCDKCHKDLVPSGALIAIKKYQAPAYTEAMHHMCLSCHVEKAKEKNKPEMTRCDWCHKERRDVIDARDISLLKKGLMGQDVVMPPVLSPQLKN